MKAVVDNDILIKGACYGLLVELISTVCSKPGAAGVLGAARYVVPGRIRKSTLRGSPSHAVANFTSFLGQCKTLETTQSEQKLAADLEYAAQTLGLNLDSGESQLCAILVRRALPWLLTGDKRAVGAMEKLIDAKGQLAPLCGKVRCLEHLFADALATVDFARLREAVCSEPDVDTAAAICFGCASETITAENCREGLESYIRSLRTGASRVLSL